MSTDVSHRKVRDSLRALAATEHGAMTALVGGATDAVEARIRGWKPSAPVRVRVQRVDWTGYQGGCEGPETLADDSVVADSDGTLVVVLPAGPRSSAFRVDVRPEGGGAAEALSATAVTVVVDEATLHDAPTERNGDDPQRYHGSGRRRVTALPSRGSRVEFPVTIDREGTYAVELGYATQATPGSVALEVDGVFEGTWVLAATLERGYIARACQQVMLGAGEHVLSVVTVDAAGEQLAGSDIAVDHLVVRPVTHASVRRILAVDARRSGSATPHWADARSGPGRVRLAKDATLTFALATPGSGTYAVSVAGDGLESASMRIDGIAVDAIADTDLLAAVSGLRHGAVMVEIRVEGPAWIDHLDIVAVDDIVAHGGSEADLASLGLLTGKALVTVRAANGYRLEGHEYNTDAVVRHVAIGQHGHELVVPVPHTFHDESPVEVACVVAVLEDAGPILVAPADQEGPPARISSMSVRPFGRPPRDRRRPSEGTVRR